MDDYLECLYAYTVDHLFCDAHLDLFEYSRWSARQDAAWTALREALTPEQLGLVEDYCAARSGLRYVEDVMLFQKAVALGKWMAR